MDVDQDLDDNQNTLDHKFTPTATFKYFKTCVEKWGGLNEQVGLSERKTHDQEVQGNTIT